MEAFHTQVPTCPARSHSRVRMQLSDGWWAYRGMGYVQRAGWLRIGTHSLGPIHPTALTALRRCHFPTTA